METADQGKDEVFVSEVLSCSVNGGKCVVKSFVVPVPKFPSGTKFPSDTKFPSEMLTMKYTLRTSDWTVFLHPVVLLLTNDYDTYMIPQYACNVSTYM